MKKEDIGALQITQFNYILPDERLLKYPLPQRNSSKLLQYHNAAITAYQFNELPALLPQESLLLFNNTRVIHARLLFRRRLVPD